MASEELGMPLATLHTWIHQLKAKSEVTKANKAQDPDIARFIEENQRLHKELSVAKEEKEILKKAAAYFAQYQR